MAGEHAGHRQRMRERFIQNGLQGFATHEILELILFYAIPQRDVNELAHRLENHFGSLHGVLEAPVEELVKVDGIGMNAATLLNLFSHAARRMELSREEAREDMSNRLKAQRHCQLLLGGMKNENFYAVCLDGQMQVIRDVLIAKGTLSEVQAYPRLIVEAVLRHNAHAVVLCHNHPGGQLAPSPSDIEATKMMIELLSGIGVVVADHIIVCGNQTLSMVTEGFITPRLPDGQLSRAATSAGQLRIPADLRKKSKQRD